MSFGRLSALIILITAIACGPAPKMPRQQNAKVELLDNSDVISFYLLPLKGEVNHAQKNWSGDIWALNKGLINKRWNAPFQDGFDYQSPSRVQLFFMTTEELAQLSPSEKFDLLLGRYDYPLKSEVGTMANRFATNWEGIRNGWAPASMNHNEPTPKSLVNPDGIAIAFGSSDIKALLSYYYFFIHKMEGNYQLGRHCPEGYNWYDWNQNCRSYLNAGSFHIVLANKVGRRNKSFLVDIDPYKEVWNYPVHAYASRVESEMRPQSNSPTGTEKVLKVKSKVTYISESKQNTWEPIKGTPHESFIVREYRYTLFLDISSNIIGGEWISEERPDFLWVTQPVVEFKGLFTGLKALLDE